VFNERDVIYHPDNDKPGATKLPGRDRRSQALPGAFALRAAGLRPSDVASVDISLGQDREAYRESFLVRNRYGSVAIQTWITYTPIRAMVSHQAYDLADARTRRSSHHRLEICSLFGLQRRRVSELHVRTNANSKSVFN
jgi:hypothetical protein